MLGTAIKPVSEDEQYDIDLVCSLNLDRASVSQKHLKELLGSEIKKYARSKGMSRPKEKRRCWTLHYSEEARFHIDSVPAIPNRTNTVSHLFETPESQGFASTGIFITDNKKSNFEFLDADWNRSNPKGYGEWFKGRMGEVYRRRVLSESVRTRASVEDVPIYMALTSLQEVVQLLKYHRDYTCSDMGDDKPISIIITTLAALSYGQQESLTDALAAILRDMDKHISRRNGIAWIANPTNQEENFADKWNEAGRERAFYDWLGRARADFARAADVGSLDEAATILSESFGERITNRALGKNFERNPVGIFERTTSFIANQLRPAHLKAPRWPQLFRAGDSASIFRATLTQRGFRPRDFRSDEIIPVGADLKFYAMTSVAAPFKVYWQVVNTGTEADDDNGLRGGFDLETSSAGGLTRSESSRYKGRHAIECFIVKDGKIRARSGQFIVRIQ